jgi:hypothetical protein
MPVTYSFPSSMPVTFRVVAVAAFCGAALFALDSYEASRDRIITGLVLTGAGIGLLRAAAFYRIFQVTLGSDFLVYGAWSRKSFRVSDVNKVSIDPIRGGKLLTVVLKSGERHCLPGDLSNLSGLADELGRRSKTAVIRNL